MKLLIFLRLFGVLFGQISRYQPSYGTDTRQCLLNIPSQPACKFWRVVGVIVMNNTSYTSGFLTSIRKFLVDVTGDCTAQSDLLLIGSSHLNGNCTMEPMPLTVPILQTTFPDIYAVPDNNVDTADAFNIAMQQSTVCSNEKPLQSLQGGVLFVFTDLNCSEFYGPAFNGVIETYRHLNYIIQILVFSDNVTNDYQYCFNDTIANSCLAVNPLCSVGIYNSSTLGGCAEAMKTCYAQNSGDDGGLSTGEIIIAVVIPTAVGSVVSVMLVHYLLRRRDIKRKERKSQLSRKMNDYSSHMNPDQQFPGVLHSCENELDVWEINRVDLNIEDDNVLGNGAFAKVVKGTLVGRIPLLAVNSHLNLVLENFKDGICEVAVKRLPGHADEQAILDFRQEIDFMKQLGYHSHVINMIGCKSCTVDPLILVEFCYYGDLLRFLRQHKLHILMSKEDLCPIDAEFCLRIKDLVSFAWQISDGMNFLASKGFVHRDLAARNVLITKNMIAKVSDFGLCRYIDSALYTSKGGRLPIKWMSIESLKRYEFSQKSDVWSFAILLFEMFSLGDQPFPAVQPHDMISYLEKGNRMDQPEKCPNEIYDLMQKCWDADIENRPIFEEIRSELMVMLNMEDEHYGYLQIRQPGSIKAMLDSKVNEIVKPMPAESVESIDSLGDGNVAQSQSSERNHIRLQTCDSDVDDYYSTTSRLSSLRFQKKPSVLEPIEEHDHEVPRSVRLQKRSSDSSDSTVVGRRPTASELLAHMNCPTNAKLQMSDVIYSCDSYS